MFRKITAALAFVLALGAMSFNATAADQRVNGYTKQDGTYVAPYMRSAPNSTRDDKFSTRGNTNPYTGSAGTGRRDSDGPSFGRSGSSNTGPGLPDSMVPRRSNGAFGN